MRVMAIDYGKKRVGVALSDELQIMGYPEGVFANTDNLLDQLMTLARSKQVSQLVMGESLTLAGDKTQVNDEARAFGDALGGMLDIPVAFIDERYSTREAERIQGANSETDASAAAILLNAYLAKGK